MFSTYHDQRNQIEPQTYRLETELALSKRLSNSLTLVARLPVELLAEIFVWYRDLCLKDIAERFAKSSSVNAVAPNLPPSNWLAVTAVCSQWRLVALGYARFWDHIVAGTSEVAPIVPQWFARTQEVPLHIIYNTPEPSDNSTLVFKNLYRTRSLVIRERNFAQDTRTIFTYLAESAANTLERLYIGVVGASNIVPCRMPMPPYFFRHEASCLTEVVLNDCAVYASALMSLPALARLELIRCDVHETSSLNLLQILGTIPTLNDLTIVHTPLQNTWLPEQPFEFANLHRLTFHGSETDMRWILALILAGGRSLEHLRFRVDVANVYFLTTEWLPVIRLRLRALMDQFASRGHTLGHVDVAQHSLGFFTDTTRDIGIALEFEFYRTAGLSARRELELMALFLPDEITPTSVRASHTTERACCIYRRLASAQKLHVDVSQFEDAVFARDGAALFTAAEAVIIADTGIDVSTMAAAFRRWRKGDRKLKTIALPPCLADSQLEFAEFAEEVGCLPLESHIFARGDMRPIVTLPWIL